MFVRTITLYMCLHIVSNALLPMRKVNREKKSHFFLIIFVASWNERFLLYVWFGLVWLPFNAVNVYFICNYTIFFSSLAVSWLKCKSTNWLYKWEWRRSRTANGSTNMGEKKRKFKQAKITHTSRRLWMRLQQQI